MLKSIELYVPSVGLSIIWYDPFRIVFTFLDIPFFIKNFGIQTYFLNFKFVAGVKGEFILSLFFFDKFPFVCVPEASFGILDDENENCMRF